MRRVQLWATAAAFAGAVGLLVATLVGWWDHDDNTLTVVGALVLAFQAADTLLDEWEQRQDGT